MNNQRFMYMYILVGCFVITQVSAQFINEHNTIENLLMLKQRCETYTNEYNKLKNELEKLKNEVEKYKNGDLKQKMLDEEISDNEFSKIDKLLIGIGMLSGIAVFKYYFRNITKVPPIVYHSPGAMYPPTILPGVSTHSPSCFTAAAA